MRRVPRDSGGAQHDEDAEAGVDRGAFWSLTLRRAIRDFKWGDYAVEPGTQYHYTVFTVYGEGDAASSPALAADTALRAAIQLGDLDGLRAEIELHTKYASPEVIADARLVRDKLREKLRLHLNGERV